MYIICCIDTISVLTENSRAWNHQKLFNLQVVSGEYCECDNFSCDRYDGKLCSGPDNGRCVCGKCECLAEYDVPGYTACECVASNETCITPYGK